MENCSYIFHFPLSIVHLTKKPDIISDVQLEVMNSLQLQIVVDAGCTIWGLIYCNQVVRHGICLKYLEV